MHSIGILTGEEILKNGLISLPDPEEKIIIKAASCDLRLGSEVLPCGQAYTKTITLGSRNNQEKAIKIESFGTILFSTYEIVKIPNYIVGRFDLMVGFGLDGLILQVGPQVEPGYEGPLFGFLLNTSGENKVLSFKEKFLTIEFSMLGKEVTKEYNPKKCTSLHEFLLDQGIKYQRLENPNIVKMLDDKLNKCQQKHGIILSRKKEDRASRSIFLQSRSNLINLLGFNSPKLAS